MKYSMIDVEIVIAVVLPLFIGMVGVGFLIVCIKCGFKTTLRKLWNNGTAKGAAKG